MPPKPAQISADLTADLSNSLAELSPTALPRATVVIPVGSWSPGSAVDRLVLTYDERHRRRMRYVAPAGVVFLLDLPRAVVLRAGDGLQLEDGRMILIEAALEALVVVTAADTQSLLRLAWHIGNRHLPAQLDSDRIYIRDDAVIVQMLRGLGARVEPILAPFTPESGAYDHNHTHEYAGGHDHPSHNPSHSHGSGVEDHSHDLGDAYSHASIDGPNLILNLHRHSHDS